MPEPNFAINFTAEMIASSECEVGDLLVYNSALGYWVVATAANRTAADAGAQAVALTDYGGSGVGKVAYQSTGVVAAEVSGLSSGHASVKLVRTSATGRFERISSYTPGDDVVGYAEKDGRVKLHMGLPWAEIAALAGDAAPTDASYVTLGTDGDLANERVLTEGDGIDLVDAGAGSTVTVHGPRGTNSLEKHGAVGDGVTSDQTAIDAAETALAAGTYTALVLGAKSYLGTWGFTVPGGCSIIGQGQQSVLKMSGATEAVLKVGAVNDVTLRDFLIQGDGTATGEAYGVKMGVSGSASSGPQRITLINVHAYNCWSDGFVYRRSPLATANRQGPRFIGCVARNCGNYGFRFAEQGEYAVMVACEATGCTYGVYIAAGNIAISGGNFGHNTYGIYLAPGTNDAHGTVTGALINHNTTAGVYVGAITTGHTFAGCTIFANDIRAVSNTGLVEFVGCRISPTGITCTDGMLRFVGCEFDNDYTPTVSTSGGSGTGWVEFVNCSGVGGSLPAYIRALVQPTFTFASDANATLTAQQSVSETLVVADGVISTSRQLTSYFGPASGRKIRIVNDNTYDVTFKWSSGTAVTIPAGEWALVGSDGTNAIALESPGSGGGTPGGSDLTVQFNDSSTFDGATKLRMDSATAATANPMAQDLRLDGRPQFRCDEHALEPLVSATGTVTTPIAPTTFAWSEVDDSGIAPDYSARRFYGGAVGEVEFSSSTLVAVTGIPYGALRVSGKIIGARYEASGDSFGIDVNVTFFLSQDGTTSTTIDDSTQYRGSATDITLDWDWTDAGSGLWDLDLIYDDTLASGIKRLSVRLAANLEFEHLYPAPTPEIPP